MVQPDLGHSVSSPDNRAFCGTESMDSKTASMEGWTGWLGSWFNYHDDIPAEVAYLSTNEAWYIK